tara:strand:+ start:19294 stop:20679 length:1386 start_codon:yes stop_codon:yes gene_type:complete
MYTNKQGKKPLSSKSKYEKYTGKKLPDGTARIIDLFYTSEEQLERCEKLLFGVAGCEFDSDSPEPEVDISSESSDTQESFQNLAISRSQGQGTHRLIETPVALNPAAKGFYPLSNSMGCAYPVQQVPVTDSKQKPLLQKPLPQKPPTHIQHENTAKEEVQLTTPSVLNAPKAPISPMLPMLPMLPMIPMTDLSISNIRIGSGGFGVVYQAHWLGYTPVAVKLLLSNRLNPEYTQRFKDEAVLHGGLRHPNIVSMHGAFESDRTFGLVLEYLPEGDLHHRLHQNNMPLTPGMQLNYAQGIAHGLSYLSSLNMIHCDLTSHNILLSGYRAKITDFGHTMSMSMSSQQALKLGYVYQEGTWPWMAPEVIRETRSSKASDIYALGVILWEMASGKHPYALLSIEQGKAKILKGEKPGDLQEIKNTTSVAYGELIAKCWKERANERPVIKDVEADLQKQSNSIKLN